MSHPGKKKRKTSSNSVLKIYGHPFSAKSQNHSPNDTPLAKQAIRGQFILPFQPAAVFPKLPITNAQNTPSGSLERKPVLRIKRPDGLKLKQKGLVIGTPIRLKKADLVLKK